MPVKKKPSNWDKHKDSILVQEKEENNKRKIRQNNRRITKTEYSIDLCGSE